MLQEAPKKERPPKDRSDPTRWQLFYRTQLHCLRRSVTVYLMYLFMSLLCLACQAFGSMPVRIVLGVICILGGVFFNTHLCYNFGRDHYGYFAAGELHRRNREFGVQSGGDHRPEREYRVWKGFLIGLYVALPVVILGSVAGALPRDSLVDSGGYAYYALCMFAGWAIIPITWFGTTVSTGVAGLIVSPYYSLLFCLFPILVSGVAYIVGAAKERKERREKREQEEKVESAGKRAREYMERRAKK